MINDLERIFFIFGKLPQIIEITFTYSSKKDKSFAGPSLFHRHHKRKLYINKIYININNLCGYLYFTGITKKMHQSFVW